MRKVDCSLCYRLSPGRTGRRVFDIVSTHRTNFARSITASTLFPIVGRSEFPGRARPTWPDITGDGATTNLRSARYSDNYQNWSCLTTKRDAATSAVKTTVRSTKPPAWSLRRKIALKAVTLFGTSSPFPALPISSFIA